MNTVCMTGLLFAEMVKSGAANLYANRTIVNDLNVFPIPDGDTGDNMYMTVDSGASAVGGEGKLCEAASKAARGMLMGARGNSGVILSRIFAGLAKGFDGKEEAGVTEVGAAFYAAVKEAYGAVAVPVEGTILTVIKDPPIMPESVFQRTKRWKNTLTISRRNCAVRLTERRTCSMC